MNDAQKRFWQIQRLVDKEGRYLQDVAQRLYVQPVVTTEWIERLVGTLGLLENADRWLSMRHLRNRLVHEYVEDLAEFAAALNVAHGMVGALLMAAESLRRFGETHFPERV